MFLFQKIKKNREKLKLKKKSKTPQMILLVFIGSCILRKNKAPIFIKKSYVLKKLINNLIHFFIFHSHLFHQ